MMFVKSSEGIPGSQPHSQEEEGEKEKPPLNGALQGPAPLQEDTTGNKTFISGPSVFRLRYTGINLKEINFRGSAVLMPIRV
jgi:hypothetical protein